VLHQNIQTDTHDSIEDARSALMLYTAYQDFEDQGILDEKLDELYREGRKQVGSHSHRSKPSALSPSRQPNLVYDFQIKWLDGRSHPPKRCHNQTYHVLLSTAGTAFVTFSDVRVLVENTLGPEGGF
jgi:hypothetical protein